MFRNKKYFVMAFLAVMSLVFIGLTGCSKAPTGVVDDNAPQLLQRNVVAAKLFDDSYYVEQVVKAAEGAVINLLDVEMVIPPGAIDNDTLFSIEIPNPSIYADHFGTDGLVFDEPVRITMSYRDAILDGVNEISIKMAWFDERSGEWDVIECELNQEEMLVTAFVSHFSAYALITDE